MHFAAHTIVPESVSNPLKYYGNNTCATRNLLECCDRAGVRALRLLVDRRGLRHSRRGPRARGLADRADQSLRPVEAHERVDAARPRGGARRCATWRCATSTSRAATRAAASATPRRTRRCWSRWPASRPPACGRELSIFGTDYPTPDGTGVRDYIHVEDLASRAPEVRSTTCAPAAARRRSTAATATATACARCSGRVERVNGRPLKVVEGPRRAGDPPSLVAHAERVRDVARLAAAVRRPRDHRPLAAGVGIPAAA